MSNRHLNVAMLRFALVVGLLAMMPALMSCAEPAADKGATPQPVPAEQQAPEPADQPQFTSWVVSIVDDDSFSEGEITYSIALNLTATNPSPEMAGEYTGTATAKTDTVGTVNGLPLNAAAVANSGELTFTLEDPTADGALATLTADAPPLRGTGSITMKAAGSGTIGAAGGGFSNTSAQQFTMTVDGSNVTMKIPISGHTYTFEGTISGR